MTAATAPRLSVRSPSQWLLVTTLLAALMAANIGGASAAPWSTKRSDAITGVHAVPVNFDALRDSVDVSVIPPTTEVVAATHPAVHAFFERALSDTQSLTQTTAIPDAGIARIADVMTQASTHKNTTVRFSIQGGDAELSQFFAHSRRLSETGELEITLFAARASVSLTLQSYEDHRVCKKKWYKKKKKCHNERRLVGRAGMTASEIVGVLDLLESTAQDKLAERHGLMIAAAVDVAPSESHIEAA